MSKTVKRFDLSQMTAVERTPQGFLRAPAYLTRTGVFKYRMADGSLLRELRHPDEVFNDDALKTLRGVPVTNDHPPEMVTPTNVKQYMVGFTADGVEREGNKLRTVMTITDEQCITDVEKGRQQVSCGYTCELDETPGVFDGEEYDVVQRKIVYNHVAVVDRGRAGPEIRIRMDADSAVMDGPQFEACVEQVSKDPKVTNAYAVCNATVGMKDQGTTTKGSAAMEKIMLGGKEYEVSPELKAALEAHMASMQSEMDGMKKAMDEKKVPMEEMGKKIDELQAKCDSLGVELEKAKTRTDGEVSPEKMREAVKARVALEKTAEVALSKEQLEKLDSMTDLEVRKAVVAAKQPELKLDGKSEHYVAAAFDIISEQLKGSGDAHKRLGAELNKGRTDGAEDPVEAARKRQAEETMGAWKKPLSAVKTQSA